MRSVCTAYPTRDESAERTQKGNQHHRGHLRPMFERHRAGKEVLITH